MYSGVGSWGRDRKGSLLPPCGLLPLWNVHNEIIARHSELPVNCSLQGLLLLGQVQACDLCIHEGLERHLEVTGEDTVKVTWSCPWVLST